MAPKKSNHTVSEYSYEKEHNTQTEDLQNNSASTLDRVEKIISDPNLKFHRQNWWNLLQAFKAYRCKNFIKSVLNELRENPEKHKDHLRSEYLCIKFMRDELTKKEGVGIGIKRDGSKISELSFYDMKKGRRNIKNPRYREKVNVLLKTLASSNNSNKTVNSNKEVARISSNNSVKVRTTKRSRM